MSNASGASNAGILAGIARWYERAMMFLGCTLLAGIVVIMGFQVFFRYVLNDSIIWSEEMCRYFLIWITFLFLGIAYQRGELISLSMLLRIVPCWLHLVLTTVAHLAMLGTLGILIWYGFAFADVNSIQTLPAFDFLWSTFINPREEANLSSWWLYVSIPVGAIFLSLHLIAGYFVRIGKIMAGEPVFPEDVGQEVFSQEVFSRDTFSHGVT
ncbi:MAG: TRAP transporter small permease, partial [Hyphomicrobiales bacterium]|nr:TRAP transporter small permease [Hyphomicrobiales bacterium]